MKQLSSLLVWIPVGLLACKGSAEASLEPSEPPAGTEQTDGGTSGGGGPKSCDPVAPRPESPTLLIGPTGLEAAINTEIRNATSRLDILMYEFDRKSVIDEVIAAKTRGVAVRVLLAGALFSPSDTNATARSRLEGAGIELKATPKEFVYSHSKVVLIDGEEALVLSANFNDYSLRAGGERNYGVIDRYSGDIQDLQAVFDRDWAGQGTLDLSCTKLVVAPNNARERILGLVNSATKTLDLAVMYLTDADIIKAVQARAAAGVAVRVLLADPNWMKSNANTAAQIRGTNLAARFFRANELHAKLILTESTALIGSQNFSKGSLDQNREIGVFASETELVAGVRKQFETDWKLGTE